MTAVLSINPLQDIRQTRQYASFMEKIGWKVESLKDTSKVVKSEPRDPASSTPGVDGETPGVFPAVKELASVNLRKQKKKEKFRFEHNSYIFIKKLPLLPFSVIKFLRYQPPLQLIKLEKLCKKHHPILVKLEPFEIEKIVNSRVYFKVSKNNRWPLVPTKTLWLDLTKTEGQLLCQMKQKTRYNLKKALETFWKWPKRSSSSEVGECPPRMVERVNELTNGFLEVGGVKIVPGNKITKKQLQSFHHLWSRNKPFNWLFKPCFNELKWLVESLGKKCFYIFVYKSCLPCHSALDAESIKINISIDSCLRHVTFAKQSVRGLRRNDKKEELLASCLVLTSQNMAFYWHNCSSREGKKLFAPTLCVWQALKESKKRGLKIFDFEGLWDERFPNLNKGWKGFTRFKGGFANK